MPDLLAPYQDELLVLGRVALAVLLGAAIGLERELAEKPAGLRTHMLVAGSAALLIGLGDFLLEHFQRVTEGGQILRVDPVRLIEALVTGVAFLGAGTILRDRKEPDSVSGLTTAATIFFTAIVGVTVGIAQYILAIGTTVLVLLTLRVVGGIEARRL